MADLRMPAYGISDAGGTVIRWLKRVGDTVQAGESLVLVETEKAAVELDSPATESCGRSASRKVMWWWLNSWPSSQTRLPTTKHHRPVAILENRRRLHPSLVTLRLDPPAQPNRLGSLPNRMCARPPLPGGSRESMDSIWTGSGEPDLEAGSSGLMWKKRSLPRKRVPQPLPAAGSLQASERSCLRSGVSSPGE